MKFFLLGLVLLGSTSSFATGGFDCQGKIENGKSISVSSCVPWSLGGGICSDIKVYLDNQEVLSVPRENVVSYHFGPKLTALTVAKTADSKMEDSDLLLRLEYSKSFFGPKNLELVYENKKYNIAVKCEFEQLD